MWWSAEDYAELNWRFDKDGRRIWAPCGIIPVAALCPLCRYRHKSHWSGAKERLDRDLRNAFGSHDYAREELRAEIAQVMVSAELGIPDCDFTNNASYISS
jgi:hypothetical protein